MDSDEVTAIAGVYEENDLTGLVHSVELESLSTASTTSSTGDDYNDVTFPLPGYEAELRVDWDTTGISKKFSITYIGAGECDGFAKYAHDHFWHLYDTSRTMPSWQTGSNSCTGDYFGATPAETQNIEYDPSKDADVVKFADADSVKRFFQNLKKGDVVRYISVSDPTPYNGRHSVVFDRINDAGDGIIVYEANQDGDCGVGYQMYKFGTLAGQYTSVLYYVHHVVSEAEVYYNATYHNVGCANCAGFVRQKHTSITSTIASTGTHSLSYGCCGVTKTANHNSSKVNTATSLTAHNVSYTCCTGTLTEGHTSTTRTYASYSTAKHKVMFGCCSGYVLQAHSMSGGTCSLCGYVSDITEIESTDPTETVTEE